MSIEIELVGGPMDDEKIFAAPEMNSRFYMTRNEIKYWYTYQPPGKAFFAATDNKRD